MDERSYRPNTRNPSDTQTQNMSERRSLEHKYQHLHVNSMLSAEHHSFTDHSRLLCSIIFFENYITKTSCHTRQRPLKIKPVKPERTGDLQPRDVRTGHSPTKQWHN